MKELKTLKDIPITDDVIDGENAVYREDLKAEAIKWIKFYRKPDGVGTENLEVIRSRVDFIKKFFNITEENKNG